MEKMANGLIKVTGFLYNREESYSLDITTHWVKEILDEIENEMIFDKEKPHTSGFLNLEFTLKKVNGGLDLQDYFILRGTLTGLYNCSCIRCLELTHRNLDLDLNCCFLSSDLEESEFIDENGTILIENDELEVFFYKKGFLDLKEFIHEAIFTTIDPLPLHDEYCKGLCPECGTNINLSQCTHASR